MFNYESSNFKKGLYEKAIEQQIREDQRDHKENLKIKDGCEKKKISQGSKKLIEKRKEKICSDLFNLLKGDETSEVLAIHLMKLNKLSPSVLSKHKIYCL